MQRIIIGRARIPGGNHYVGPCIHILVYCLIGNDLRGATSGWQTGRFARIRSFYEMAFGG